MVGICPNCTISWISNTSIDSTTFGDLEKVVEFSVKYPRGDLGISAPDQEQNILLEFQQGIIEKLQEDVERLKDKQRDFANGNHD